VSALSAIAQRSGFGYSETPSARRLVDEISSARMSENLRDASG
jgi:hypothetical protein